MAEQKADPEEYYLGIELGSTRIKAVLTDGNHAVKATGTHGWENRYEDGYWTYPLESVWDGMRAAFGELLENYHRRYRKRLQGVQCMCISGMMHGYLPFDRAGKQLTAFRTWRNTTTAEASEILSERLGMNIPQRWSAAHLYQAVLNGEAHVREIGYINTLAGYVHRELSGRFTVGSGEASGMFPLEAGGGAYDEKKAEIYEELLAEKGIVLRVLEVFPAVSLAGENAGYLTERGARLLDPSGELAAGICMAPPEGDAGTGMVATDCVRESTGNVSAGTSIFAMLVLQNTLRGKHREIDLLTTPSGRPVAMVHCNTGTTDLDAWVHMYGELAEALGVSCGTDECYRMFYRLASEGASDCGGIVSYNYCAGEPVSHVEEGCPMLLRDALSPLTARNLVRSHVYAAFAVLRMGMDLLREEGATVTCLTAHGGLFKTPMVSQQIMADALNLPVIVRATAGEGGAWGAALLACYAKKKPPSQTLEEYLEDRVFAEASDRSLCYPEEEGVYGFEKYLLRYKACLDAEREGGRAIASVRMGKNAAEGKEKS